MAYRLQAKRKDKDGPWVTMRTARTLRDARRLVLNANTTTVQVRIVDNKGAVVF